MLGKKGIYSQSRKYHDEYLHALVIAVNTIPDRSLSFQVVFTGCESDCEDNNEPNIHGGAMWARMSIQALYLIFLWMIFLNQWKIILHNPGIVNLETTSVIVMDRVSSSPWLCKLDGEFFKGRYLFTVDYTDSDIADDSAQHKQSHVLYITEDCKWKVT